MWVGGYDDWTSAEQREGDQDIAELEAERENEDKPHWLELAIGNPLFISEYSDPIYMLLT